MFIGIVCIQVGQSNLISLDTYDLWNKGKEL